MFEGLKEQVGLRIDKFKAHNQMSVKPGFGDLSRAAKKGGGVVTPELAAAEELVQNRQLPYKPEPLKRGGSK